MQNNNLTQFNEGGTHESNPYGGIAQGQSSNGNMNTVEEGETKKNNFIYSNRIVLDKNLVKQFNLPPYIANKSVADASKLIDSKFKDRQDKYAQETKNTLLDRLSEAQEHLKQQEQADFNNANQAVAANSQEIPDMMNGEIPEGMERFIQPQEGDLPVAAYGGYQNKYFDGGQIEGLQSYLKPAGLTYNNLPQAPVVPTTAGIKSSSVPSGSTINPAGALNVASTALDFGKTIFGKSNVDTSGQAESQKVDTVGMIGNNVMKGASAGAAFGPIGAGVGALVGGITGLIGSKKAKKAAIENTNNFAINTNKQFSDQYALGGEMLNPTDPVKVLAAKTGISSSPVNENPLFNTKRIVKYQPGVTNDKLGRGFYLYSKDNTEPGFDPISDREFIKQSEMLAVQRTPEWKEYMLQQSLNNSQNKFVNGGDLKPLENLLKPSGLIQNSNPVNINDFKAPEIKVNPQNYSKVPGVVNFSDKAIPAITNNIGEVMRYAPVLSNALQLKNLKKPTGVQYNTLDARFKPEYVDEASMRNIVDQEANNQINALTQSGASQGAVRNAILGAGLNKTKALSDAYMNASAQNRAMNVQAQTFNRDNDLQNINIKNRAIDEMRMDDAAYRSAKSKLQSSLGTDVGNIGKEIADAQLAAALTGYTRRGKYLYKPDGTKATSEEISRMTNTAQKQNVPTLKKGDKYLDENGRVQTFKYGGYLKTNKR